MSKTLSKTSKSAATEKVSTGNTKAESSLTPSNQYTPPTWYLDIELSNSKVTSIMNHEGSYSLSFDAIPESTCEFYFLKSRPYGRDRGLRIQVGRNGLAFRLPSGEVFRKIGWKELARLEKEEMKKLKEKESAKKSSKKRKISDIDELLDEWR